MNSYSQRVTESINKFNANQLIIASQLHKEKLSSVPESTYYKNIERLVKRGDLVRVSKGIYSRPKKTRFGSIGSSENEIINHFIENQKGIIIGYRLYNRMGLTTQISKKTEILSNAIRENKKKIANVSIFRLNIELENSIVQQIEALEVLENYGKIEDMNYRSFVICMEKIAKQYNDKAIEKIINNMHYKKSTIAFLQMILNHFCISNSLSKYLSSLSKYKIPGEEVFNGVAS